jgi:hypothetical protein
MIRKSIPQIGPFRYICKTDIDQPLENRLKSLNNLELNNFFEHNAKNRHVFVYEFEGKILCILVFDDKGDHFYLNLIENNEIYEMECDEINPASKLIRYVEKVSKSLGYDKIRLDALEQLVPYYEELGYSPINETYYHKDYGLLVKMKKLLSA